MRESITVLGKGLGGKGPLGRAKIGVQQRQNFHLDLDNHMHSAAYTAQNSLYCYFFNLH